ncbi:MAG: hypothetical protein HYW49_08235 [Deltaproteobacteria bacterium]|nr:hypothetical protein [Deltaproteobacteria bacterium]
MRLSLILLLLVSSALAQAKSEAKAKPATATPMEIIFVRHLDPGGTEGYRLACAKSETCLLHVTRNGTDVKTVTVPYEKASAIAEEFFKDYTAGAAREPSSGPPLLTWEVTYAGRSAKGLVPWRRELRAARPPADQTRAILALEYHLMELDQ